MAPGGGTFTWRPQSIEEDTWLVRWDGRHPRNVFRSGFEPRVNLAPAYRSQNDAMDLRSYVADSRNTPSVFVSTTRQRDNGRFWTLRSRSNIFRYDIFAPGGIDVNPTLGPHTFNNQNEIAFVGGIQTRYIYGALELDSNQRQYRYHLNPNFNGNNGQNPRYCRTPHIFYTNLSPATQPFCAVGTSSSRKKRSVNNDDYMKTTGDLVEPDTSCSYCYRLGTSLQFYQPDEVGDIGDIIASIGSTDKYVWSNYEADARRVSPGSKHGGTCAIFQSTTANTPRVCYDVKMYEDDNIGDDIISDFSDPVCQSTNTQSSPATYKQTSTGTDGSVILSFTVEECRDCYNRDDCC